MQEIKTHSVSIHVDYNTHGIVNKILSTLYTVMYDVDILFVINSCI